MNVVAVPESRSESYFDKECASDHQVAEAICKAMDEAVAASHEMNAPVFVEATWADGSTSRWKISVEVIDEPPEVGSASKLSIVQK